MDGADRIITILRTDAQRWRLLGIVRQLSLPDCWIGAGFVRNAVWDALHERPSAPLSSDVDLIWFDPNRTDPVQDCTIEDTLRALEPSVFWSVKNQARMHLRNGDAPYASATDAMRFWPETATAIAARRTATGDCEIAAPFGTSDLLGLVLRPTPRFEGTKNGAYEARLRDKNWQSHWPRLHPHPA